MSVANRNTLNLLQMGTFITVSVVFRNRTNEDSKPYTYKVPKDWDIEEGDFAIADSPNKGYEVVRVTAVHAEDEVVLDDRFPYKWLVCRVDPTWYIQQEQRERKALRMIQAGEQRKRKMEVLENLGLLNGGTQSRVQQLVSPTRAPMANADLSDPEPPRKSVNDELNEQAQTTRSRSSSHSPDYHHTPSESCNSNDVDDLGM